MEINIKNRNETAEFAKNLAEKATKNSIIGLKGDLGAGKTFFARHFINALQEKPSEVLSPTFNIVTPYQSKIGAIFHFDLYRLKSIEELENIGFFDYLKQGICLIEWPQIVENYLKKQQNYIAVTINQTHSSD